MRSPFVKHRKPGFGGCHGSASLRRVKIICPRRSAHSPLKPKRDSVSNSGASVGNNSGESSTAIHEAFSFSLLRKYSWISANRVCGFLPSKSGVLPTIRLAMSGEKKPRISASVTTTRHEDEITISISSYGRIDDSKCVRQSFWNDDGGEPSRRSTPSKSRKIINQLFRRTAALTEQRHCGFHL